MSNESFGIKTESAKGHLSKKAKLILEIPKENELSESES